MLGSSEQGPAAWEGFAHFVRFLLLGTTMYLSLALLVGFIWIGHALRRTGYRARDIVLLFVPVYGIILHVQTIWRYTANSVYWTPRSDLPSSPLFADRQDSFFGLYDRPFWNDWLFRLVVPLAVVWAATRAALPNPDVTGAPRLILFVFGLFPSILLISFLAGIARNLVRDYRRVRRMTSQLNISPSAAKWNLPEERLVSALVDHPSSTGDRPRQPPILFRVGVIALAVVGLMLAGDWFLRNLAMDRLVDAVEKSETVVIDGGNRVAGINEIYSRALKDADRFNRETVRRAWIDALEDAASEAASDVIETGTETRDVGVLPWHNAIQKAKSRYLAHSKAWEDFFSDVAQEGTQVSEERPKISATFAIAEKAFRKAVPPLALFRLPDRVEAIFAE